MAVSSDGLGEGRAPGPIVKPFYVLMFRLMLLAQIPTNAFPEQAPRLLSGFTRGFGKGQRGRF